MFKTRYIDKPSLPGGIPYYENGLPCARLKPGVNVTLKEALAHYEEAQQAVKDAEVRRAFWEEIVEHWKEFPLASVVHEPLLKKH